MSYVKQNNQILTINKEVEHTLQYIKHPSSPSRNLPTFTVILVWEMVFLCFQYLNPHAKLKAGKTGKKQATWQPSSS